MVCDFVPFGFDRLGELVESMTGLTCKPDDLQLLGERISNMTRMYNIKNGRTRKDDTLPARFFEEEHVAGLFKGKLLTREIFSQWLDMYYKERGWDGNGVPTPETLERLHVRV